MRLELTVLVCSLVCSLMFSASVLCDVVDQEDYLGVIGPAGTVTGVNYSEYTPAFEEFIINDSKAQNLTGYPEHLSRFLEGPLQTTAINYSLYPDVFRKFIFTGPESRNLSGYPEHLSRFLEEPPEIVAINYTEYTPAFEIFMIGGNESEQNESERLSLESYPAWMRAYLEN